MLNNYKTKIGTIVTLVCLTLANGSVQAQHNHQATAKSEVSQQITLKCKNNEVLCAKTVTAAFSPNGDLWRVWVIEQQMYYQISKDNGQSFLAIQQVKIPPEKISARNENRPKIGFDKHQGVYLSWATPREKMYTADIRFSYSANYGKSFSVPVTVNNDNLLAGHSFNEMLVTENGDVNIVWLDGRLSHQLKQQGKTAKGSVLYYGKANIRENITTFTNQPLANDTCVCCRIAVDFNKHGELAILWRHIYGDNIREFALLTLNTDNTESATAVTAKPIQISYDHWKINGCPHQGGGITIDQNNVYHMVWFNQGDKGKGIFYASSADQGKTLSQPLSIGDVNSQAAHPHVMKNNNIVDIVWSQYNGNEHQLWHQQSLNHGKTFTKAKLLAQATSGSDRPFIIKKAEKNYVSWQRPDQGHWIQAL